MSAFFSFCLVFFSFLAFCAGQELGVVEDLAADHAVSVLLTPKHTATLRLNLEGSTAEEIILDGAVSDITYRIAASEGTKTLSGRLATFGWAAIPVSVAGRGEIQIQLQTESQVEGLPGVRVRVELRSVPPKSLEAHRRAAQLFNGAQPLHRSSRGADLRQAIAQFEQAAQVWAGVGDLYGEALALGGEGESELGLSRYAAAQRRLDRALALAGKSAYLRGWLLHLQARVLFDQWEGKLAEPYSEEELQLGEEIGDPALIALARTDLIGVAYWSRNAEMENIANQAHYEAIDAGVPDTLALERRWKAWIDEYYERGLVDITDSSESEAYFRRAGDGRNALDASIEVAEAVGLNGDSYLALAAFSKLDPIVRDSGSSKEYGTNLLDIGIQYKSLNNLRLARIYFRRADAVYASAHILFGRMLSHESLCKTEPQGNEVANSISECKLALSFANQFGDAGFTGHALCDLGIAEFKARNLAQASDDFNSAADETDKINDPRYKSKERIEVGELLEKQGEHEKALVQFEQAESSAHGVADPTLLLEAQYAVARSYLKDGQFAKADAELTPALQKLEETRQLVSSNSLQASYFAAERKCYELAIELRMTEKAKAGESELAKQDEALALEMSERSRARGLLDALSRRSATGTREGSEVEGRRMQAKLMAVDRAFERHLKLLVEGGTKRDLETNSMELTRALGDLERIEDQVHAAPNQSAKPAITLSMDEIKAASLASGVTFFEYALGDEHSFLWVIDGDNLTSYPLPPRDELEKMVKKWRVLATSPERGETYSDGELRSLSANLFCTILNKAMQAHMTRMVIVPDGGLAMLPFAALQENDCSGVQGKPLIEGQPLVLRHEITLTPSLSIFLSHKPAENRSFVGEVAIVADPVFDTADQRVTVSRTSEFKHGSNPTQTQETAVALPRLLKSRSEAKDIEKAVGADKVFLVQGFAASVETVLGRKMQDYRIWHLATHGVYDETTPEFSGLVFSLVEPDGNPRFGFLKADDIARLNLSAELVVLSACDSAAGENLSGEGVMGLSYSFLRAGARQVISTLWSIDDEKSSELMSAFYTELMRNGGNAGAALRQSQLFVMRQSQSSAPYYWAGFELTSVGE